MDYCEFTCDLDCLSSEIKDLLTAFLAEVGFESFYEDNNLYKAYIQAENLDAQALQETMIDAVPLLGEITYTITKIPSQDWNTKWEESFEFIEISPNIIIHIPNYQPTKSYDYELIIKPEMAFGSGTHETTSQILQTMETLDFKGKSVADCGCGTGILGIFASKLGAKNVFAFDYDSCCIKNTINNLQLNCINNIETQIAKLNCLQGKQFDIVIANINRNILVENMSYISQAVVSHGFVILSGFYSEDVSEIQKVASVYGLQLQSSQSKNNWTITTFIHI